jgi:hypothetical protein
MFETKRSGDLVVLHRHETFEQVVRVVEIERRSPI